MVDLRKKLLHIITLSEWAGAQNFVYTLTKHQKKDYTVTVACAPGGILVKKLKREGINVVPLPNLKRAPHPLYDIITLWNLFWRIKKEKFDIVHTHSTKAGIIGRIAAGLAGVEKIFFTVHGWGFYNQGEYGKFNRILILLEKISARFSTAIICVSKNDLKEGLKNKIAPPDKFIVIHYGTTWDIGKRGKLRKEIDADDKDVVFGMVARLAYQKNPRLFLEAAKILSQRYNNAKFVLVGDGPYYTECEDYIRKNTLNNVFLLGFRDGKEIFPDFDVFVLSSRFEGLPITIIEALFTKLPVIATKVGGVEEEVEHGENGFLVVDQNARELSKCMEYFIKQPGEIEIMGNRGYLKALNQFTLEKMLKSYDRVYEA
jgi:glycosyltransferase involved in cell wall biosynthesis